MAANINRVQNITSKLYQHIRQILNHCRTPNGQSNGYKLLANLVHRGLVLFCPHKTQSVTYNTQYIPLACDDDLLCLQQQIVGSQFSELLSSSFHLSHFKQTLEFNARTWIVTKRN